MPNAQARRQPWVKLSPEVINILGISAVVLVVLAIGSAISAVLPNPDVWQVTASFAAPASLAFAVHWWMSQKL
jgi:hypothetical protein